MCPRIELHVIVTVRRERLRNRNVSTAYYLRESTYPLPCPIRLHVVTIEDNHQDVDPVGVAEFLEHGAPLAVIVNARGSLLPTPVAQVNDVHMPMKHTNVEPFQ